LDSLPSTWHARSAGSEEARGGVGATGTAAFHRGGAAQRWGKGEARCKGAARPWEIAPTPWTVEGISCVKKMDRVLQGDGSDRRLKTTEKALLAGGNAMGERGGRVAARLQGASRHGWPRGRRGARHRRRTAGGGMGVVPAAKPEGGRAHGSFSHCAREAWEEVAHREGARPWRSLSMR
jgi:hypothetical protein